MGSTKTQETKMPQWQEDFIRQNILPLGEEIGSAEYTPYQGEMIAGMSGLQNQALSGFGGLDMGGQTYDQAIGVQQGLSGFSPTDMSAAQLGNAQTMGAAQLGPAQTMAGVGAVDAAMAPGQIGVNQLATTNFDQYMSPYTQNVINRSLETLGGAQEQALNTMGAQATAAGAFGGSRQGVAEAATREAYGKQAADLVSGLQEKAYTQALQSGQFDIGNVQQARGLQSGQQMTANTLGQQAREAAASRDQAAQSGNMAAANQFATQQAQLEQAARSANMSAQNQFATQQAQMQQAANAANYQGQFGAADIQGRSANAMGALGGDRLQSQLSGLGAQMSAGDQQRALQQAQLQADYAAFQQQQGYPLTQLNALLSAGAGVPQGLGTVTQHDPFGGMTAVGNLLAGGGQAATGAKAMGWSDVRLKENITPVGSQAGVNFYTWDWNEAGENIAHESQPRFGVMAQELEKTHPDLVVIGDDGYRRVKYDELYKRIGR